MSLLSNSLKTGLAAGWITTALGGLLAGKSSKTDHKQSSPWLDRVSRLAPYVFLIGLVCVMSWLANALVARPKEDFQEFQDKQVNQRDCDRQRKQDCKPALAPDLQCKKEAPKPQPKEIPSTPRRKEFPPAAERDGQVTYRSTFDLQVGDVKHEIIDEQHFVRESDAKAKSRERYSFEIKHPDWGWLWGSFGVSFIVAMLASWRVDVNEFSLNALYANRLMRCYLGASRRKPFTDVSGTPAHNHGPEWNPNRVTGFDPRDDVDLVKFRIGGPQATSADRETAEKEQSYWGPLPLINTALNLVSGDRLAWQERMAESFLLSPQFCGAKSLGYRDTEDYAAGYAQEKPLTLGRSVAISGAAANPNMGYHSSPAVTALMTLFNVRLGWWLPNPRKEDPNQKPEFIWKSRGPEFLLKWLAIELFSLTNSKRRYLNISDGGHFENLGVYELVRRRCRLIIVSDAGADPNFEFEDLGGLIRKCRTDFGVDIEIDVSQLRPDSATRKSKWHCVIGTIRYDHVEPAAPVGTLIYLKPSLSGDEPADLLHYAEQHADFPHQPTLDQFFNESQFESYRALGYHVAMQAFDDVARRIKKVIDSEIGGDDSKDLKSLLKKVREAHDGLTENLVYALRKRWLAPLPDIDQDFLKSTESFTELQEAFRDKPELNAISRELYGEVALSPARRAAGDKNQVAELHTASLMLQVMENAWLTMHLETQHAHPLNAGWMNVFQRWTHSPTLQTYWPLLRNEYSRDFVFFCERETALKTEIGTLERLDASVVSDDQWQRICEEYWREWPKEFRRQRGVDRIKEDAVSYSTSDATPDVKALWTIRVSPQKFADKDQSKNSVVAGLVGVRKLTNKAKLTFEELKTIEPGLQKKQQELDQIQKGKEAFWELTDEELDAFAQQGIAPSRADLDSRLGYELVVWVRPGFRHLKVGQKLIEGFFNDEDKLNDTFRQEDCSKKSALRKKLSHGGRFKLAVYFPKSGSRPSEDKFAGVKSLWLAFFTFYGFRRPGKDTRRPDDNWPNILDDEILVRDSQRWT